MRLTGDVRFALRGVRRGPVFASVAVLSLGIAIGAVIAMFRVVDALDLRGLRYPHRDRLVVVGTGSGPKDRVPFTLGTLRLADIPRLRARAHTYEQVEAVGTGGFKQR